MNARIDPQPTKSPNAKTKPSPALPSDQVAAIAYHLYLESGRENGHDQEHWYRAEQLLKESLARSAEGGREEADPVIPKRRGASTDHSKHRTTGREEVRRHQIPPAARQSLRQSK
jgi:hypothetical protein